LESNGFEGHNELFINSKTFTEVQPNMVLDLDNYSSSAHFFDYDLDGDLDMYLLNHAVHSEASLGMPVVTKLNVAINFPENDNGKFTDSSEKLEFWRRKRLWFRNRSSDFNLDGYLMFIFVTIFHEDDYYLNVAMELFLKA
jgi:hypothetical protein